MVARILKHNMDFGKSPRMRSFVQDYILALKDDETRLEAFVSSIHGAAGSCPHPRILPNLASICFSAVNKLFDEKLADAQKNQHYDGSSGGGGRDICQDKENHNFIPCEPWKMMSVGSLGSTPGGDAPFGVGSCGIGTIGDGVGVGCVGVGVGVGSNGSMGEGEPVFEFLAGVPLAPSALSPATSSSSHAAPSVIDVILEEPASTNGVDDAGNGEAVDDENGEVKKDIRSDKNNEKKDEEKNGESKKDANDDDDDDDDDDKVPDDPVMKKIACFCRVIRIAATFEDWRQGLGLLLQPVPFR